MNNPADEFAQIKTAYRKIFIDCAKSCEEEISKLKPETVSGEIFDDYSNNPAGRFWQKSVSEYFETTISEEISAGKATVLEIRNNFSCNGCGVCCKFAVSEFSPKELQIKANNGDNFAKQFINTFIPYETTDRAQKIFPQYVKLLTAAEKTGYYFYHCPKVTEDNRCPDYENRPQICRDFPDNPIAFLAPGCGYNGWNKKSRPVYMTIIAKSEIKEFYTKRLKKIIKLYK